MNTLKQNYVKRFGVFFKNKNPAVIQHLKWPSLNHQVKNLGFLDALPPFGHMLHHFRLRSQLMRSGHMPGHMTRRVGKIGYLQWLAEKLDFLANYYINRVSLSQDYACTLQVLLCSF